MGPSGAGKSTLICELFKRFPERFGAIKTLTTRPSRGTEEDNVFYDFTTLKTIQDLEAQDRLIQISEYAGNFYANDRDIVNALLEQKIGVMAIVEMGVRNFRAAGYHVVIVRIVPQDAPVTSDDARRRADEERIKDAIEPDITIVNSFLPGGKEKAVEELLKFTSHLE